MRFASILSAAALFVSAVNAAPAPQTGVDGCSIEEVTNALQTFFTSCFVWITLDSLTTNLVSTEFKGVSTLPCALTIDRVISSAGVNGVEYLKFDQTFSGFTLPASGTGSSGRFDNVLLTQGALNSLDILALGYLDLINTDIYASTENGPITVTGINQTNVPTAYTLDLGGL